MNITENNETEINLLNKEFENICENISNCFPKENETLLGFIRFLNIITLAFSIIGNVTILLLTLRHRIRSRIRATYYILNIVLIDLLITTIYIPRNLLENKLSSDFDCKLNECGKFFLISSNVNITATLSICRLQVARNRHLKNNIKQLDKLYISLAWLIAFILSIPSWFINKFKRDDPGNMYCGEFWHEISDYLKDFLLDSLAFIQKNVELLYQIYVNLVHFTIPFCIICFAYCYIWYIIQSSMKISFPKKNSLKFTKKSIHTNKSKKVMRLAIILILAFVICWLPLHIWHFIEIFDLRLVSNSDLFLYLLKNHTHSPRLMNLLAISYCCFNPIIILMSDSIYQKYLKADLKEIREKLRQTFYETIQNSSNICFVNKRRRINRRLINHSFDDTQYVRQSFIYRLLNPKPVKLTRNKDLGEIIQLEKEIKQCQRIFYL